MGRGGDTHRAQALVEWAVARLLVALAMRLDEVTQRAAPVGAALLCLGCETLLALTCATLLLELVGQDASLLPRLGHVLIDLLTLVALGTLLVLIELLALTAVALGVLPVVRLWHTRLTARTTSVLTLAPTTLRRVLEQVLEHLDPAPPAVLLVDEYLARALHEGHVGLFDEQVDDVVLRCVGCLGILLDNVTVQEAVLQPLVEVLVQRHVAQLLLVEVSAELLAVPHMQPVGSCGGYAVADVDLAGTHDTRKLREVGVVHDVDVDSLESFTQGRRRPLLFWDHGFSPFAHGACLLHVTRYPPSVDVPHDEYAMHPGSSHAPSIVPTSKQRGHPQTTYCGANGFGAVKTSFSSQT